MTKRKRSRLQVAKMKFLTVHTVPSTCFQTLTRDQTELWLTRLVSACLDGWISFPILSGLCLYISKTEPAMHYSQITTGQICCTSVHSGVKPPHLFNAQKIRLVSQILWSKGGRFNSTLSSSWSLCVRIM